MRIAESELIINGDGSVFHLHLCPEELADNVILVGDPGRVDMVAGYFEEKEFRHASREFVSVTGKYKGTRITVLSTGIGTDNIDIVMNELDALANIVFMMTIITINLGIVNLLPLPALDGGRMIALLFEMITKKRIPQKIEGIINNALGSSFFTAGHDRIDQTGNEFAVVLDVRRHFSFGNSASSHKLSFLISSCRQRFFSDPCVFLRLSCCADRERADFFYDERLCGSRYQQVS